MAHLQGPTGPVTDDLFLTAPIGIYRSLPDGSIAQVNPALARILGYDSAEELARHSMRDLYFHPDERERLIALWEPSGAVADLHVRWRRRDGSPVWVTLTAHAVKDESGITRHFLGFVRDASLEYEQQERLATSEARLRTVLAATHHAVWDWDLATGEILWGEGFASLFGYESEEERTDIEAWRSRVHPDDVDRVSASLDAAVAQGRALWREEYRFRRAKGGWAIVADQGLVLRDDDDRPVRMIGAMRDITEQRAAEEQLRHAQKMEAVGQLTGGIAHDFNNMLTVIFANAELLESGLPESADVGSELRDIKSAARRGQVMVGKLLGFARRTALDIHAQDLAELVQDAGSLLRRLIPESITVAMQTGGGPHIIQADGGAVEQILVNLTTNARDAMPHGGTIRISVHRTYLFDIPERTEGARPGAYVCLTVSDNGVGMDLETRDRMFEPFFTTKGPDRGTGLGLAMVYGLVRQLDGFVQVTSTPGDGTSVRVFFPAVRSSVERAAVPEPVPVASPSTPGTVLVAEDEEEVRLASKRVLERLGYRVVTAVDGEDALTVYRRHAEDIRLVLSDVVMPRRNGPDLLSALRAEGYDVPVLFASGYPARDLQAASSLPADAPLLRKPWTVDELATAIRDLIGQPRGGT